MAPAERCSPVPANVIALFDEAGPNLSVIDAHHARRHSDRETASPRCTDRRTYPRPSVAVLLPCRNEAVTITKVIEDFRRSLPEAAVYVYDNASTDGTAEVAAAAGAIVRSVREPGKGNVMRRMFAEIEASAYVVADGDDTYESSAAPALVHLLITSRLDMVVATRQEAAEATHAYRRGHRGGNQLLTRSVQWMFGTGPTDMLSGYRVLSRRYVKSFPAVSNGFEIETEMTVHALELMLPFDEVPTTYGDRPACSCSKLRTLPDGFKILAFILKLYRNHHPWIFFGPLVMACWGGAAAATLIASSTGAWTTGTVVALALALLGTVFLSAATVLGSLRANRREIKRMHYLAVDVHAADLGRPVGDRRAVPRGAPAAVEREHVR